MKNSVTPKKRLGHILVLFAVLSLIFSVSCISNEKTVIKNTNYVNLSAPEFKEFIAEENVFILDVHIPEQKHILGTDAIIPFDKISENLDKLPIDKNAKIAVYCRSGSMSKTASEKLVELGYTNIKNLAGGINDWKSKGYPVNE